MLNNARERKGTGTGVRARRLVIEEARRLREDAQIHADMLREMNHQVIEEEARRLREDAQIHADMLREMNHQVIEEEARRLREEAQIHADMLTEKEMNAVKEGRIVCENADGTLKIAYDDGTEGFMIREQITHVAKRRSKTVATR